MKRTLDLVKNMKNNSYFLFGARGVGKSYLIRETLSGQIDYIDLLSSKTFLDLQSSPSNIETYISKKWVVIDEIQRIPELLNEVHRLIEEKHITFLLTGSSARKLRRSGVNLLAGRAYKSQLLPLSWKELINEKIFKLDTHLHYGGLPSIVKNQDPAEYLYSYVDTYLKEEIQAEALVRNLSNYARFLDAAALMNGEMINFTKIANDAQLRPNTVRDYYQILQDTLIGEMLEPWTGSVKRKAIQTAKFYFFDLGVVNTLKKIKVIERNSDTYGKAFEHFIYLELKAYITYSKKRIELNYWRSKNGHEVDFIVDGNIAIEVKTTKKVSAHDLKGLNALSEEQHKWKHMLVVSQDTQAKSYPNGISQIYWEDFLNNLWNGKY